MRSPNAAGTLVYFSVDDCAAASDRAVAHGSDVVIGKQSIGDMGFIAIMTDSEGNSIGMLTPLHQHLAGIEKIVRVQRLFDCLHHRIGCRVLHRLHIRLLVGADAMLGAD